RSSSLMLKKTKNAQSKKISDVTVRRLSAYLRTLDQIEKMGVTVTSSRMLADMEGVRPSQVRKDLSYFGTFGIRGYGYPVSTLKRNITKILGLNRIWNIALIGAGQFGNVFMNSETFEKKNLRIVQIFDSTPELIGRRVKGVPVSDIENLEKELDSKRIDLAIVAVSPPEVQSVINRLGKIGVRGALYFASRSVDVPENMVVRNQDLSIEVGLLTYYMTHVLS
ncbi:MAG: redox-sensing transcriptional repressor Rex, partial [Pseudomonadota bacterium]